MATRRSVGTAVAAALGVLLAMMSGGTAAVAAPDARDGVAAVIASYQVRIPVLMAEEHIPRPGRGAGRRRPRGVAAGVRFHRQGRAYTAAAA
jgi:hypothetical protein